MCWYIAMHDYCALLIVLYPYQKEKKYYLLPKNSLSLACSWKMDEDSFGFIRAPLLFIALLCRARSALLCSCKDAGACGVHETFLCPGGILCGERLLVWGLGCGVRGKATMQEAKPVKLQFQCMAAASFVDQNLPLARGLGL